MFKPTARAADVRLERAPGVRGRRLNMALGLVAELEARIGQSEGWGSGSRAKLAGCKSGAKWAIAKSEPETGSLAP